MSSKGRVQTSAPWPRRLLLRLVPKKFAPIDTLNLSAKRFLIRVCVGLVGTILGVLSVGLLAPSGWKEVAAGALLASSFSLVLWAVSSYRQGHREIVQQLRHTAEMEVLHGRLNQIAAKLGLPTAGIIERDLDRAINFRMDRLAHLAGIEDVYYSGDEAPVFWDNEAQGES